MTHPHPQHKPEVSLHIGNIASFVQHALGVEGVLVITANSDDTIGFTGAGLNHAAATMLLARGIHITLSQHDEAVLAGAAGEEAQEHARVLEESNHAA